MPNQQMGLTSPDSENGDDRVDNIMDIPGAKDLIDPTTFEQILEMDEDDVEREFSRSVVFDFFGQADTTFKKMEDEFDPEKNPKPNLKELSELGHFLKGSSATLGLTKVQDQCTKIQHYGQKKDDQGSNDISEEDAVENLKAAIKVVKLDFKEVEKVLKAFYGVNPTNP